MPYTVIVDFVRHRFDSLGSHNVHNTHTYYERMYVSTYVCVIMWEHNFAHCKSTAVGAV